jgi:hypothetical protein
MNRRRIVLATEPATTFFDQTIPASMLEVTTHDGRFSLRSGDILFAEDAVAGRHSIVRRLLPARYDCSQERSDGRDENGKR